MEEIKFSLDTFYALMSGALVMWMAAGFTMLEAGLVQKKDVAEIVTKNLGLYSIACIMYLLCGFMLMYPSGSWFEGSFLSGVFPFIGTSIGLATDLPIEEIGIPYGMDYSQQADFFFQVVFVATAMSIVSGAVAGRMRILPFFLFSIVLTGFIYPMQGYWNWGGGFLSELGARGGIWFACLPRRNREHHVSAQRVYGCGRLSGDRRARRANAWIDALGGH